MGLFIVFEGCDGSGKSTQAALLLDILQAEGHQVIMSREPGGTPFGESLRNLIKSSNDLDPLSKLLLISSSRTHLVKSIIQPALDSGRTVVCDRFAPSTIAYQGYGSNIDLAFIDQLNQFAIDDTVPDLVILLDMPVETSLGRKTELVKDSFEKENVTFHNRVRQGYLEQAKSDPAHWLVLDGTKNKDTLFQMVWQRVSTLINATKQ
jgi:dTMP kinase